MIVKGFIRKPTTFKFTPYQLSTLAVNFDYSSKDYWGFVGTVDEDEDFFYIVAKLKHVYYGTLYLSLDYIVFDQVARLQCLGIHAFVSNPDEPGIGRVTTRIKIVSLLACGSHCALDF